MNNNRKYRELILNQSSYWLEKINGLLYNSILEYMEAKDLNRTRLADHLGISKGRVSQILNDGEINFSTEKLIEIALKVDKFPILEFKDKNIYIEGQTQSYNKKLDSNIRDYLDYDEYDSGETKVISLIDSSRNHYFVNIDLQEAVCFE